MLGVPGVCCLMFFGVAVAMSEEDTAELKRKVAKLSQEVEDLRKEVRLQKRICLDSQLELIRRLNTDLLGQENGSSDFELAKRVALVAVKAAPRESMIWKTLCHTGALEGYSLKQAEELLGSHTENDAMDPFTDELIDRPVKLYSWYYNPSGRHVAPALNARVKDGKLVDWFVNKK